MTSPREAMTEAGDSRTEAQRTLFTSAPVDEDDLMAQQGITAPQGLEALSDPEWDDATDSAYLAALLSK